MGSWGETGAFADGPANGAVRLSTLRDASRAWQLPPSTPYFLGGRLLADAPRPSSLLLAVTRAATRTNRRLAPLDALELAAHAVRLARRAGIPPELFCATLLQESGFDPAAHSAAGAVGIAQFTIETADAYGIDPFDWRDAMRGSARLLARYIVRYRAHRDPYAIALAAYNAGPAVVTRYGGVPPYDETRDYITDIYDRWSRMVRDQRFAEPRLQRNAFQHFVNRT